MLFVFSMHAQVTQEVIASSGGYNVNGNVTLSWTLGETVVSTLKSQDGTLVLSHGFQQKLLVTAVEETIIDPVKIRVFPNPVTESVNIQFDAPVNEEISLDILDSQGKLIKTDFIGPASTVKEINMQDVPGGVYYLRLSNGKNVNVYKVVKL
jgi:hypothetical protein